MKSPLTRKVPTLRFAGFNDVWKSFNLEEISDIKTGPFGSMLHEKDYVKEGTPIITVEHLSDHGIIHRNLPLVSQDDKTRLKNYILKTDDVVFSRVGSVDRNSIIQEEENGWLFSGRLLRLRMDKNLSNSKFLSFCLQQEHTKYRVRSVAVGQTMPSLNTNILRKFPVLLPEITEQQKIAAFLSSVDTKIGQLDKKKALLGQYKKGMMQKLFSQELRFKDDKGNDYPDWVIEHLDNIAKRVTRKNTDNSITRVLTNSAIQGVLEQGDYFDNDVANKDNLAGYYIVRKGDYVYNPRISASAPVGPINKNELADGVISPLYTVFRFNSSENEFYKQYFKSSVWYKYMYSVANYGARHDRMSISTSDFTKMPLPAPCNKEQQKISDFLSAIDKKIELVSIELEQARTFKKGLLQQMFV